MIATVAIVFAKFAPATANTPLEVDTVAHRGAAAMAPENTPAGLEFARHTHARYIEVDVQLSADGVPVIVHDVTLTRTSNAVEVFPDRESYAVTEFTWDELQQLDAGSWYHEDFAGERIPRLEDVIDYARSGAGINIELKDPALSPGVEQVVADVLAADDRWHALNQRGGLVVSSFDIDSLATFHGLAPHVPVGGIGGVPDDATLADHATWMASWTTNYRLMDDAAVDRVQVTGMEFVVYTVNSPEHMLAMVDLGVDGIVTDAPQVLERLKFGFDPLPDANGVVVSEVVADVPGVDIEPETGEHVVLHNTTDQPVDVDGWFLLDAVANRLDVGPGYVIPPDGTLGVYTGPGTNTSDRYYNDFGRNVLNNNGDSIAVFTPDRELIDLFAYY